ncbi:MAG: penicillin acylase family protein, partial [Candidatus Hodarchaeota archaeon]
KISKIFSRMKQIKLKKQQKLIIKQCVAAAPAVALIVLLSVQLFNIAPPLGDFLQPIGGIYDHLDDGQHPELEIIRDSRLRGDVTVYRDEWGVPHIYADDIFDLGFAEGYCMALDRIFEMDLLRRVVTGRLAEFIPVPEIPGINLPPQTIAYLDSYFRFYGLHHAAQDFIDKLHQMEADLYPEVPPEASFVYGFQDGVNMAIEKMKKENRLPIEYSVLSTTPAPWEEMDMAAVSLFAAFMLSMSTGDLDHTALYETLGTFITDNAANYTNCNFSVLFPEVNGSLPYQTPIIPDNNSMFKDGGGNLSDLEVKANFLNTTKTLSTTMKMISKLFGFNMDDGAAKASNNWVAAGNKTMNGLPILCSDPHLVLMQPAIFYEVHLVCKTPVEMNVHGVAFPGAPVVVIGFNDKIAWGITSHSSDNSVDYYYETLNADGTKYFFNNSWLDLEIHEETIKVRNGDDYNIKIRYTHHGPIITDFIGFDAILGELSGSIGGIDLVSIRESQPKQVIPMSMSWVAEKDSMHERNILSGFLKIMTAENRSDFEDGLKNWTVPPQNLVFACIDGDIGMYLPGLHPIREKGGSLDNNGVPYSGSFIQPGNGSGEEWVDFLNFSNIPKSVNPVQGYLASANQRTINWSDAPNITVGRAWSDNYRGRRINYLLNTINNITIGDMKEFQADIYDIGAERFIPPLLDALANETLTGDYNASYQELLAWNNSAQAYEMRKELVAPLILDHYLDHLSDATWDDEWEVSGATGLTKPSYQYLEYMIREDQNSPWFDNVLTGGPIENASDIMVSAFNATIDEIKEHRGSLLANRVEWLWGRNHKFMPLSIPNVLELFVGRGESIATPIGGSGRCLQAAHGIGMGGFTQIVAAGASWRHIVDFSNIENPITCLPVGNSGVMFSTHWDDQYWLYVNCQYKTVSRADEAESFMQSIESTVLFEKT